MVKLIQIYDDQNLLKNINSFLFEGYKLLHSKNITGKKYYAYLAVLEEFFSSGKQFEGINLVKTRLEKLERKEKYRKAVDLLLGCLTAYKRLIK